MQIALENKHVPKSNPWTYKDGYRTLNNIKPPFSPTFTYVDKKPGWNK